jgi:hypothetical protein
MSDFDDFDDFEQGATRRVSMPRPSMRLPSVELVVVEGKDRGLQATIRGGVARIGTARGSELELTDPTVSRLHCEIRLREICGKRLWPIAAPLQQGGHCHLHPFDLKAQPSNQNWSSASWSGSRAGQALVGSG